MDAHRIKVFNTYSVYRPLKITTVLSFLWMRAVCLGVWLGSYCFVQKEVGYNVSCPCAKMVE